MRHLTGRNFALTPIVIQSKEVVMELELIAKILGWVVIINFGVLLIWFLAITFVRDWFYKVQNNWFSIPKEKLDLIHYCYMAAFELIIFAFFLAPYIAIRMVT